VDPRIDRIGVSPEPHAGSFITAAGHELRITRRCLVGDLQLASGTTIEQAGTHPIVGAFEAKRSSTPADGETIGPTRGLRTLYKLRGPARTRGATLHDRDENVVWLCAYGHHESGSADDAYKHFAALMKDHQLDPTPADYIALGRERRARFLALLPGHADRLFRQAVAASGSDVVQAMIGRELPVRMVAQLEGDLVAVQVAFTARSLQDDEPRVLLTLAAVGGDREAPWELVPPGGFIRPNEVGFLLYRATPNDL
jgi:hypothetical protein